MIVSRLTTPIFLFSFVTAALFATAAGAQVVGSDEYVAPQEGLPGEASAPPTATHPDAESILEPSPALTEQAPRQAADGEWTARVRVVHASDEETDLSELPVLLSARRAAGPFESGTPSPTHTWTGITGPDGIVEFTNLPDDLAQRGLRLQASTSFGGIAFDSMSTGAADGAQLELPIYDRGHDLSGLRVSHLRVVVEPWEEYLIFSQFWTLTLDADHVVDISLSPDPALQRGLRLRLPVQAEGIHFTGPGDHEVINNFIFWKGVLVPGQPITFQIRFSKSARSSELTYEQFMDFPVDEVQIVAPVQTQYEKMPRLDELALLAPGFDTNADLASLGLRTDMELLVASGRSVEAGDSFAFRVEGLPFRRPIGGWVALFSGILAALFVAAYGRREFARFHNGRGRTQLLEALNKQREVVLDELSSLERDLADPSIDDDLALQMEEEEALLRERLALILRKIRDIEAEDDVS